MKMEVKINGIDVSSALSEQWNPVNTPLPLVEQRALKNALEETQEKLSQSGLENEQLKRLSLVDELTQIFNLRGFNSESEKVLSLLKRFENIDDELRRKTDGAIYCLIDLDGFKKINDTYGHAAGDVVLQNIAKLLEKRTRPNDVVARTGGDELSILVRISNQEDADDFVTNLQKILDNNTQECDGATIQATGTVGYSFVDVSDKEPIKNASQRADADMYEKKRDRYPNPAPR